MNEVLTKNLETQNPTLLVRAVLQATDNSFPVITDALSKQLAVHSAPVPSLMDYRAVISATNGHTAIFLPSQIHCMQLL